METKKWKNYNAKSIAGNLRVVFKTKDISKLRKSTYDYLYQLSGFIAHYDLGGFQAYYQDLRELIKDIQESYDIKYPREDFSGEQAEYYQSKAETAREVKKVVDEFEREIWESFSIAERQSDVEQIKCLMSKNNLMEVKI